MNKWDLSGALNGADPAFVEAAAPEKLRESLITEETEAAAAEDGSLFRRVLKKTKAAFRKHKALRVALPIAAMLALALILEGSFHITSGLTIKAYAMAQAEHPEKDGRASQAKQEAYRQKVADAQGSGRELDAFFADSMAEVLGAAGDTEEHKNQLYSPLNAYMALAMLAECTGGESRAEILQLLGAESIEALREQASAIYLANSLDSKEAKSVLYNSIWLDQSLSYNENTVKTLADTYYASSFRGEMGSEGYNRALRTWLNEATDGLLDKRYINGVGMTPNTVISLVSALNLDVKWDIFKKNDSFSGTFYTMDDRKSVTYMNSVIESGFYVQSEEKFTAVSVTLGGGLKMWLILPYMSLPGVMSSADPRDLLTDESYQAFVKALIRGELSGEGSLGEDLAWRNGNVHLTLPRFDITAENDLKESLRRLGVNKVLSMDADFSALTAEDAYLSEFKQAARLIADEEGIRAVSFTFARADLKAALPDEITLVFNRPFLFILTSPDNLPLYAGIVYEP